MDSYTVIARKYRPQNFSTIVGQEPIVTTLKNSLRLKKTAHAYLFTGPRGIGKTTLARVLAKALNCHHLTDLSEPCNRCCSCTEIMAGKSLDILEVDGASNRGIDDIREITETAGYATASSQYRIYIIDEVHMLTKEAFNALLKTLEEPPQNVKFFMATTEPHRIPATIISRCQRFDLARIRVEDIEGKLREICNDLGREAEKEALRLIANRAEGGLRDAESLLDQILSYSSSPLSLETVTKHLGLAPSSYFFSLDAHFAEGKASFAFELASEIMEVGYDPILFLESLAEHYRLLLLLNYDSSSIQSHHFNFLHETTKQSYLHSATLYTLEQCLYILDFLVEWLQKISKTPHIRIVLELILTTILRSRYRVSLDILLRRVEELESGLDKSRVSEPLEKKNDAREELLAPPAPEAEIPSIAPKNEKGYDNIIHFAAVELEGSLKMHIPNSTQKNLKE